MTTKRQLATLALVALMIFSAGCAGWGTDGPANDTEPETNTTAPTDANTSNDSEADTTNTTDGNNSLDGTNTSDDSQSSEGDDNASAGDDNEDGDNDPSTATQDTSASSQPAEAQSQPAEEEDSDSSSASNSDDSSSDANADDSSDDSSNSDSSSTNSDEQEQEQEQDSEPEHELHTLTVSVTSPEGNAVEGADVSVVTYDGGESVAEATTNEDGEATFEVENGDYEILVSNTQFGQPSDERLVTVDGEDTTTDIQMSNGGMYTYSLTVQVVNASGEPIPNELVQIGTPGEADSTEHYITDENGEVTISFQNSSESDAVMQTVIVRAEPTTVSVTMGEQTEQITATGDRETYDLTVNAGAEGEDITVERWDSATTTRTTGEDGTATFTVYPGEYTVSDGDGETAVTVDGDREVSLGNSSSTNSSANESENETVVMQAPLP